MTRALVDTNILIYSVDTREGEKHNAAVRVLDELTGTKTLVVSTQNLAEFSRVLLEKTSPPLKSNEVITSLYDFIRFADVVTYSEETVIRAVTMAKEYDVHFFDALLAATMQENGVSEILTEDTEDFRKIKWLTARNPLKG